MKKIFALFAVAFLLTSVSAFAEESFVAALWTTPEWQTPALDCDLHGLRLEVWGRVRQNEGCTIGIVNEATGKSCGFEWGAVNLDKDDFKGVQWGIFSEVKGDFTGWQASWFACTQKDFTGLQGGVVSYTKGAFTGVQVGFVNYTPSVTGVQFGFVNYTEKMKGVQIGLVNIIRESPVFVFPFVNLYF